MELHLIRHPRPDVAAGVCYGQSDVGLVEAVDVVAARLRPHLPERFVLHASPLARARLLAEALGQPVLDARLKEMHFGEWELRPFADIGPAIDAWAEDPMGFRAPGGESAQDMAARALDWLDTLVASAPADPVVIVAHGGPLRAIAGHLLKMPAQHWLALDFACGHVTRIDVEQWGVVLKWFNR
ncbi:MAG TPA: alpha-ribazole phosphatase family protein [Aromatoleum sp.]|uniref:alpha-ribazole phosphatase family protein n=1 Tax=Aromatoleum sp. TaxID=2307007 RepID=UPI002B4A0AFC|nr:alpha-ribazole phosphatase family protein [Aromatoleum sp.]HJV28405.1 alpha-ribazole phosphatase family protein [Aromatoleum sp.]